MPNHGFVRVAAAVPALRVADVEFNVREHLRLLAEAEDAGVRLVVFPECSLTGYTCGDLFHQDTLLAAAEAGLKRLHRESEDLYHGIFVTGLPARLDSKVFNVAAVCANGTHQGLVPKTYLPNYKEFYDARHFASGRDIINQREVLFCGENANLNGDQLWDCEDFTFGVEICEDLWMPIPPSSRLAINGATILVNLSASNETIAKANYRKNLVLGQSARCLAGYIYTSSGYGESTTDLVFGGHAMIAENGILLAESRRFQKGGQLIIADIDLQHLVHERSVATSFNTQTPSVDLKESERIRHLYTNDIDLELPLYRTIDAHPFVPSDAATLKERCDEIFHIQTTALGRRLEHAGLPTVSIGVSGGLDSTLALLVLCKTADAIGLPRSKIRGLTMPGFGTTERTKANAWKLMDALGISGSEIDIRGMCFDQMKALGHAPFGITLDNETLTTLNAKLKTLSADNRKDLAFENTQARVRTSLLMNAGFTIGTGDLSELCLGWCTYNADHMSMYNPNVSIPKTLVKFLVKWTAENEFDGDTRATLLDVLATEISPELLPIGDDGVIQSTEGTVGPYELHDFFLYHLLRWGSTPEKILFLATQAKFDVAYSHEDIKKWLAVFLKRFFANQFKRSCLPDGPKVGSVSVSPRGDWRMPSDASAAAWLASLENAERE